MLRRLLQVTHPKVFAEICSIEPETVNPSELTTGSGRTVLWRCSSCAHEWRTRVVDRTKGGGHGCPYCSKNSVRNIWQKPSSGMSLIERFSDIAAELIEVEGQPGRTAADLPAGSTAKCLWKCTQCGHHWKSSPSVRTNKCRGCPSCAHARMKHATESAVSKSKSLSALYPRIAEELVSVADRSELDATSLHPDAMHLGNWQCSVCSHEWCCSIKKRTRGGPGSGCPHCGRLRTINARRLARPGESILDMHPEIAAEFLENLDNELSIAQLKPNSNYKCRWRCRVCRYEWEAVPNNRISGGSGCPACFEARRGQDKRRPKAGSQTAYQALESIAVEFTENLSSPGSDLTKLRPGSSDKCVWNCSTCGHIWTATVNARVAAHRNRNGAGCRQCYQGRISAHRRTPKDGMSLAEQYPRISQSFVENITTPGAGPSQLKTGSNDRCRWRCPSSHEWVTTVLSRTSGSECSRCVSAGRSRFELEVTALMQASCNIEVICDYEVKGVRGKSGRPIRIDIFVPAIRLHLDLDPLYTHRSARSVAHDQRKSELLRDLHYV